MKSFQDKVAAITGAGSGIGRALAVELARRGCHLALSDLNEESLASTVALLGAQGSLVTTAVVDVSKRDAVESWADQVVRDHGRVNLIFNNAGVALGASVGGMTYADFEWLMGINFWGVVHGTKAFLPHLKASGDGHVVNISSVAGLLGVPGMSAYAASKFAVRGFTESLRQELEIAGFPVSATSVHPGGIKTNIAKAARVSASLGEIGWDQDESCEKFERLFTTTPERAARKIIAAVRKKRRRVLVGVDAYFMDWMVRLLPSVYQRLSMFVTRRAGR
jgi:NAD(P)-dependent dehydrogenase (short-subunit alcohol dehydrogenase family)